MKKMILTVGLTLILLGVDAQVKVFSGGNTLIGSSTPSASPSGSKLQTVGNGVFTSSTSTVITSAPYVVGTNTYSSASAPDYTWFSDANCGIFHPGADKIAWSTNGTERMRLTDNGLLVGVTTDPGNIRLDVSAASNSQAIYSTSSYTADFGYHQINNVNRAGTKALAVQLSGTDKFIVTGGGDVWCAGTYTGSDRNLKENIDTLKGALGKVIQLQGVTYNFKPAVAGVPNPQKQIGLIAQDVEIVVPEVVGTNDNGIKGIAYQNLTALLIEAIKEQNKQITQLRSDLTTCCLSGTSQRGFNNPGNDLNAPANLSNQTQISAGARLWQNTPNPFNQTTVIKCYIPDASKTVSILIFDLTGALKKTVPVSGKGEVNVTINAKELVAGMYHYSLIIDGQEIDTKKMILTE